jgi:hypothetical protein
VLLRAWASGRVIHYEKAPKEETIAAIDKLCGGLRSGLVTYRPTRLSNMFFVATALCIEIIIEGKHIAIYNLS